MGEQAADNPLRAENPGPGAWLGKLAERARAVALGELVEPPLVAPRHAVTVVLVREGPAREPEVLLLWRAATLAFAPGYVVFPGGRVDVADSNVDPRQVLLPSGWDAAVGAHDGGPGYVFAVAAVREVFEEVGVWLGGVWPGGVWLGNELVDGLAASAAALESGALDMAGLLGLGDSRLAATAATLDARGLIPLARWVTPTYEMRRYDTRFLLARLPAGQSAQLLGTEADRIAWMSPTAALAEHQGGRLPLLPPTLSVLTTLARARDCAEAFAIAGHADVRAIAPRPVVAANDMVALELDVLPAGSVPR